MATATKTPAKRAASQTSTATAVKSTRARSGSAAKASPASTGADGSTDGSAKKSAVKRALNGTSAHAPKLVKGAKIAKVAKTSKASRVSSQGVRASRQKAHAGNGAMPDELVEGAQDLTRNSQHDAADLTASVQASGPSAEVTRPDYWDKACADLVKRDRILKKLIPKFGPVHLMSRDDPFVTLARSVVGQQISVPSAQAAWHRIESACPKLVPQQFIKLGQDRLMACGLSKRKAEYILDLAEHFVSGALHVGKWTSMEDEAVIAELTQIRGISRWTAEMFLIFNLSRPDVLPLDDPSLIRAISVNYFSGEPVTRSEAREVSANWEPWRTVATWYMWRSLDPVASDA
jgi:DNA-3-methyladenine glycosylase II